MAALIASFTCSYFLCSDDINHPHPAIRLCVQPYYTLQTFPGNAKPPGRRPKPEKAKKRDRSRARLAGNAARGSPGVLRKTGIICKFFSSEIRFGSQDGASGSLRHRGPFAADMEGNPLVRTTYATVTW